jgi:hypothetical protein
MRLQSEMPESGLLQSTIGKFCKICEGVLAGWLRPSLGPAPRPHVAVHMAHCLSALNLVTRSRKVLSAKALL